MISSLTFGRAVWLWMMTGIIPLLFLFWSAHRRRERLLAKVVAPRLRASLLASASPWKKNCRAFLLLLSWIALVLALAEPRWGYEEKKLISHGRDVMLAIDTSRSMLATDVTPTRLGRAELLGQDVLDSLPGDRVGLIAFAGNAFLQAPLTLDHNAVTASLAELDTTLIPKGGTNISEAIRTAERAFGKGEGTNRALIIITDGEDLEEDAVTTAKQAAAEGIKIFTIGIGSTAGSLIPIKNENGGADFVRDSSGKPVLSKLDEARLKEIAHVTGGFYEPASSQAAKNIVEKGITSLEAGTTREMSARRPIERYAIPASAALLLLLLSILLNGFQKDFLSRLHTKKFPISILLLTFLTAASSARATSGIQEYQQGDYEAALQNFEQRLQKIPSSPEVRFDAGTAAYKKGDYQKAADYFTGAMTTADAALQQAATYNLANTLVRTGEKEQERSTKLSDWKNALQHYETVLKQNPNNKNAKENRDLVKKLIEELQKKPEEKTPPSQNQNQSQNQSQSQSQPKQDSQQSKSNQPPPQQKPQQQQGQNQNPSQQQQQQPSQSQAQSQSQSQSEQQQPQQENKDPQNTPSTPSPDSTKNKENADPQKQQSGKETLPPSSQQQPRGSSAPNAQAAADEKKNGKLQNLNPQGAQATPAPEEEKEEEGMSHRQAEGLLRSVQEEEQQVKLQQHSNSEEVTKDW